MSHHQYHQEEEEDATATAMATETLARLRAQQESHPLTILSLAEPIIAAAQTSPSSPPSSAKRKSTTSTTSDTTPSSEIPTPTTLSSDLTHYRALFSKLRFSYLEQVTKEKYLRSIVGEPPLLVSHAENAALEEKLRGVKADLKKKKDEVEELVVRMEDMARSIAERWEGVQGKMGVVEDLERVLGEGESRVRVLRGVVEQREGEREGDALRSREVDPRMNVSLAETEALVAEQRDRGRELDRLIAALQAEALPAKMEECEVVQGELEALERRRNEVVAGAVEARRVRDGEGGATGVRDELEYKGRWYRSAEVVLSAVVGVDA